MIASAQIAVNVAAVALAAAETNSFQRVDLKNKGANPVFIGDAAVTAATGYELATGAEKSLQLGPGEALYGIATVGPNTVHVLRTQVG
jgi:hypothetical protein